MDVFTENNSVNAFEIAFYGLDGEFHNHGSERIAFEHNASDSMLSVVVMSNQSAPFLHSEWYGVENRTDIVIVFSKVMLKTQHKSCFGPVAANTSPNITVYETLNLGVKYRWNHSKGVILGLPISPNVNLGHAYDYNINNLNNYSKNSRDLLKIPVDIKKNSLKSPRFF